jgi:iron complex outermembrane receptor protein
MKLNKLSHALLTIGFVNVATLANPVLAQQTQTTTKTETTEKVQKVEVVGSNIKRTAVEGPSPIHLIKAEDIMRSGASNITELMQMLPSITSGGMDDITSGNGFAAGTATASMRGMGSSSTLILINGRRIAASPAIDPNSGQSTLFNLNSIPLNMVERVDVLLDAASAVYGSDAMAGVINYVLKKEYKGLFASARANFADQGDFASQNMSLYGGFGDLEDNGYNIMFNVDLNNRPSTPYSRTKGLNMHQVENTYLYSTTNKRPGKITDFDSTATFTPNYWQETRVGGGSYNTTTPLTPKLCPTDQISTTILTSGAPACAVDLSQWSQFVSEQKSANAFVRANFKISDALNASVELSSNRIENSFNPSFATLGNGVSSWFDPSGKLRSFRYVMPANHPDNPLFQADAKNQLRLLTSARLADVPTSNSVVNTSNRLVAEISGTHFGWDWNTGLLLNQVKRNQVVLGRINSLTAQTALEQYRFGGVNSPSLLQAISQPSTQNGVADAYIWDLKGSRELGQFNGNPIGFATGVEFRQEKLSVVSDENTAKGNFVSVGGTSGSGSRNIGSYFAEVNVPVLKSLDVSAAARYDHFSDYGSNTTPQLKIMWRPLDSLAFRASYAEGFRAPTLGQLSSSNVTSFTSFTSFYDAVRCPLVNGVPTRIPGATGYASTNECSNTTTYARDVSSYIVANPNMTPETSVNKGFGIIFAPTANFSGTVDFYEILRKNEVDRYSATDIIRFFYENGEQAYGSDFFRATDEVQMLKDAKGNVIPGTGAIAGIKRKYDNFGSTRTRGADINLNHRMNLGAMGKLETKFDLAIVTEYRFQRVANGPYTDLSDNGDHPRLKGNLAVNWTKGEYTLFGRANYVGDYALERTNTSTGSRITCSPTIGDNAIFAASVGGDCRASSWTTFDFGITYRGVKNLTMNATVKNAFAKEAVVDPFWRGTPYYNTSLHNIRGRNFSLSATYKFF